MKKINLYSFDELSEEGKKKVIENYQFWITEEHTWSEAITECWEVKLEELGFEDIEIFFSLSYSQGDGAMFQFTQLDLLKVIENYHLDMSEELRAMLASKELSMFISCTRQGRYYHEKSTAFTLSLYYEDTDKEIQDKLNKEIKELDILYWLENSVYIPLCEELKAALYAEKEYLESYEYLSGIFEDNDYLWFTEKGEQVDV